MFFIIWGKQQRREHLGVVADWCQTCQKPQPFAVEEYYLADHVYGITVNKGSYEATVRECWGCGAQFYCAAEDYERILSVKSAQQLTLSELLRKTNPQLPTEERPSEPNVAFVAETPFVLPAIGKTKEPAIPAGEDDANTLMHRYPEAARTPTALKPFWARFVLWHILLLMTLVFGLPTLAVMTALFNMIPYDVAAWLAFALTGVVLAGQAVNWVLNPKRVIRPRAWATAFAFFALGAVAVLSAETVRAVKGWPVNADCFPHVAGPRDEVCLYLPERIKAVKGYWKGAATVEVSEATAPGFAGIPLRASSGDSQWGGVINLDKNESASKSVHLWTNVRLPDAVQLSDQKLSLRVNLIATWPEPLPNNTYVDVTREFNHQTQLQLASPNAGITYLVCWWLGMCLGWLLVVPSSYWMARLAD